MDLEDIADIAFFASLAAMLLLLWLKGKSWKAIFSPSTRTLQIIWAIAVVVIALLIALRRFDFEVVRHRGAVTSMVLSFCFWANTVHALISNQDDPPIAK